jgi:uncharacterized protein (UPF0264 family)
MNSQLQMRGNFEGSILILDLDNIRVSCRYPYQHDFEGWNMRIMISVLSASEAREAIAGGAEILDVKNPAEGSLGAQPPHVIREIKAFASDSIEVSAAIGDMPYLPGTAALAAFGAASCGADYVKVGLKGPGSEEEAISLLREVQRAVRGFSTSVIAVCYADFRRACTLNPDCLPRVASAADVRGCLLDTAIKDGNTLLDFLDLGILRSMTEQAHGAGLLMGFAGSLREEHLPLIRDLGTDVVGLRTSACRNGQRSGPLEAARVRQLKIRGQATQ